MALQTHAVKISAHVNVGMSDQILPVQTRGARPPVGVSRNFKTNKVVGICGRCVLKQMKILPC
jgi:hypothetical protein